MWRGCGESVNQSPLSTPINPAFDGGEGDGEGDGEAKELWYFVF